MPCYSRVEVRADDEKALRAALKELGLTESDYSIVKESGGTFRAELKSGVSDKWGFNTSGFSQRVTQLSTFHRASAVAKAQGYFVTRKETEDGKIELYAKKY